MARETTLPVDAAPHTGVAAPWAFFACGGNGYAFRLNQISEIVPPQPVTRLPGCGPAVCGLIGLRGRVITVFDLGVLMGGEPATSGADHRVLMVRCGVRVVGLVVEELVTIAALDEAPPPAETGAAAVGEPTELVVGGRTFKLLDPERLLGPLLA